MSEKTPWIGHLRMWVTSAQMVDLETVVLRELAQSRQRSRHLARHRHRLKTNTRCIQIGHERFIASNEDAHFKSKSDRLLVSVLFVRFRDYLANLLGEVPRPCVAFGDGLGSMNLFAFEL